MLSKSPLKQPSLQCRRFLWARNLLVKAPFWNFPKRGGDGASQRERGGGGREKRKSFPLPLPPFLLSPSHSPYGLLFLLSPIFHCHKIKDGGYNNTNTNKVSPTQNTPALQAKNSQDMSVSKDIARAKFCCMNLFRDRCPPRLSRP